MDISDIEQFGISVILPMYNEKENIRDTLLSVNSVLLGICSDYEIIVCNDGSSDGSEKIVKDLANNNNKIRLIGYKDNKGYGYALRYGFSQAKKGVVVYTDSDLPCDISVLKDKLRFLNNYDCIVGVRSHREFFLREIYSFVYNGLIRAIFAIKIKDVNFSFKVFKKAILDSLNLRSSGPFIDAEMMAKAIKMGYRVAEIEVEYLPRKHGKSRLSSMKVIFFILFELLKFYPEIIKIRE